MEDYRAKIALNNLNGEIPVTAYKCEICHGYHVSHRPDYAQITRDQIVSTLDYIIIPGFAKLRSGDWLKDESCDFKELRKSISFVYNSLSKYDYLSEKANKLDNLEWSAGIREKLYNTFIQLLGKDIPERAIKLATRGDIVSCIKALILLDLKKRLMKTAKKYTTGDDFIAISLNNGKLVNKCTIAFWDAYKYLSLVVNSTGLVEELVELRKWVMSSSIKIDINICIRALEG